MHKSINIIHHINVFKNQFNGFRNSPKTTPASLHDKTLCSLSREVKYLNVINVCDKPISLLQFFFFFRYKRKNKKT